MMPAFRWASPAYHHDRDLDQPLRGSEEWYYRLINRVGKRLRPTELFA